ncbi:unnamed protein product [Ilex paraguariensis]|uniref:Uncharacterized protein n=1 Tax=Ilex paraguariensis TaxID=185542 RepID=A0ABC8T926_9AQUA
MSISAQNSLQSQPETPRNSTTQMKRTEESHERKDEEEEETMKIWDCGSPLYDSYELVSLTHHIEKHFMTIPSLGGSRHLTSQFSQASMVVPSSSKKVTGSSVVAFLADFVEKNVWKRRDGERKDKPKKLKTGVYKIYNRIGSWRK